MISDRKKIDIPAGVAQQASPTKTEANISNNVFNLDDAELVKAWSLLICTYNHNAD